MAASEAVALFNIPGNAARLQAAQNECKILVINGHSRLIFIWKSSPNLFPTYPGAGDISKFFMLCIPIATEILGQVHHSSCNNFFQIPKRLILKCAGGTGDYEIWL